LADRLNHWRSVRSPGHRIPEALWKAATALARVQGIAPVSAALKLNYYDIQRRLGRPRRPRKPRVQRLDFVELAPLVSPSPARETSTVEILRSSGARLTLRLPHPKSRDLLPLVQAFLRA
jgi:hypothetical protein